MSMSAFSAMDAPPNVKSTYGQSSTAAVGRAHPSSRIRSKVANARHVPAEPPNRIVVAGSEPPSRIARYAVTASLERRRIGVARRQAVVDAERLTPHCNCVLRRRSTLGLDAAADEPTAVEVEDRARGPRVGRNRSARTPSRSTSSTVKARAVVRPIGSLRPRRSGLMSSTLRAPTNDTARNVATKNSSRHVQPGRVGPPRRRRTGTRAIAPITAAASASRNRKRFTAGPGRAGG